MRKKKTLRIEQNYLELIPQRNASIRWNTDENGRVTLEIDNKGFMNRLAQKLFKKPKISFVYLDEMGSFVWPLIDGETNIIHIGELVREHFGEKADPLYERLAKYFKILESYGFVSFDKTTDKKSAHL